MRTLIAVLTFAVQAYAKEQVNNDINNTQKLMSRLVDKLVDLLANRLVDSSLHAEVSLIPNSDSILGIPEKYSSLARHPHLDHAVQEELRKGIPLDQLERSRALRHALGLRGGGGGSRNNRHN
eukprot:gnl/MRDRNA2_/MRDRNA2_36152_c0_seq1.p1 gnl/MRDRNA2_/MRDRNA2_36152_c0~~gnl/MRDRNA2_/MRDRNA2_36152_c0_seq1.p1  ORF type:complete len:123 (+),score=12.65 gnl/MRDRNA2_/MRDRNA2_36152_c0_seq1:74-442(+)